LNFYSGFIDSNFGKRHIAFMAEHKSEFDSLKKAGKEDLFAEVYLYEKHKMKQIQCDRHFPCCSTIWII